MPAPRCDDAAAKQAAAQLVGTVRAAAQFRALVHNARVKKQAAAQRDGIEAARRASNRWLSKIRKLPQTKAAKQRNDRRAQPEQGCRDAHEQPVLGHVRLEQQVGEPVERREECHCHRGKSAQECGAPPGGEAAGQLVAELGKASQVEAGCRHESDHDGRFERPRRQQGARRVHGLGAQRGTAGCAELRAGGSSSGWSVYRKATSAETSGGLRCLP